MPGREIAKGKPNLSRAGFKDFQNNKTRGHSIIPLQIKFQVIDLNSGGGGGGNQDLGEIAKFTSTQYTDN